MHDQLGYKLNLIHGRSKVQLRVRPSGIEIAIKALGLPNQPLRWEGGYPAVHWLAPDIWLFTSDSKPAQDIIYDIDTKLSGQLYAATDMSSSFTCFELHGPATRRVISMGCGLDMHPSAFRPGHCARTHFAGVQLFIVAIDDDEFNLYIDRSFASYLSDWIADAGNDPLTHDVTFPHNDREAV